MPGPIPQSGITDTPARCAFRSSACCCRTISVAGRFSSEVEGEQVEDSIRIISGYSDVIVIRHPDEHGARRAGEVSAVPVINAGDGNGGQHPTQALLDLYTIYRQRPLNGLCVAIIGELDKGRTARSLAYLLAKFERVKMFFVSPPQLQMKADILAYLDEHGVRYELESDLDRVIGEVDVVYQTRIRPERVRDTDGLKNDGLKRMPSIRASCSA
jgi:aspartate carbamoyltransferase catalytic subunit